MSARHAWLFLILAGCVDETGYLDTDLNSFGGATDDLGAEASDAANGTGVYYTAETVLSSTPAEVTVLGLPGVLDADVSATLSVVERPQAVPLLVTGAGFVGVVSAALGDTVQIRVGQDVVRSLTLSDDLSSVQAPQVGDTDGASGGGMGGGGSTDAPAPAVVDGKVQVGDGSLAGVSAPYIAWIAARHEVAEVPAGDTNVTLNAQPGDKLCVAAIGATGTTGTAVCFTL